MPEGVGYGPQNTASVGLNLNIIGDHAYAYNHSAVNNETVTFFEFETGNYYFVGTLGGGRNMKSLAETECTVQLNNVTAFFSKWENGAGQTLVMPMVAPLPLVIAPYTKVKIFLENDANDTLSLVLAGRIYR